MAIVSKIALRTSFPSIFSLLLGIVFAQGGNSARAEHPWELARLRPGVTVAENGLWIETPLERRFHSSHRVVIAELSGPGVITMIHFALPERQVVKPKEYALGRELLLKMYWDGETTPSVDCPLVDFFCDPEGLRERIDTALVNKKRGWNAYFPMPFRKSARVELVYEGPVSPGEELWQLMPCYSYVLVHRVEQLPEDIGYFHAQWRKQLLNLAKEDYVALEAVGQGKFVGWNVTVRLPGRPGYPVDENEKFYIDGASIPSVEFQGIEDSFGFSWGFPPEENFFAHSGWFPFLEGAAAYRFFVADPIYFQKSLKVTIGFGEHEHPLFRQQFGKPGNKLEFTSTCYWYQTEPHAPFPPMLSLKERGATRRTWKEMESPIDIDGWKSRGVRLHMRCGRPEEELVWAAPGFGAEIRRGFAYSGWPFPVFHTRADEKEVQLDVIVPPGSVGTLRLYMIDPDLFRGGRHQEVFLAGKSVGVITNFEEGRWLEIPVTGSQTQEGRLALRIVNLNPESNAVLSIVEWVQAE